MTSIAVNWAKFGLISASIAKLLKTKKPPVLVMSLPRSGSSWIGMTLGNATDALYCHEPMRRSCEDKGFDSIESYVTSGGKFYFEVAKQVFMGLPCFPEYIIRMPSRWSLRQRSSQKIVIKEVVPYALGKLIEEYSPRVVVLLRHPAAIAQSFAKHQWFDISDTEQWRKQGEYIGERMQYMLDIIDLYEDKTVIQYESFCNNPLGEYKKLYEFTGLTWNNEIASFIEKTTSVENSNEWQPYGISRSSNTKSEEWKLYFSDKQEMLEILKNEYKKYNLPFYRDDTW